jgi:2-polyprenyl-6-methoxyphenol hydroxylase-like FAD-dependent oxidoreductase
MLARLLLRKGITVTIFEAETSIDCRTQGGTLDLHDDTGLAALREAGLYEEFLKHARFDGDALQVCDKHMRRYINLKSSQDGGLFSQRRPEIDRAKLREILIGSLPRDTIRWGCRLLEVDPTDFSLVFEHGVERGFDLIVGADGAHSKVRSLLTKEEPFYSGVGGYNLSILKAETDHPHIYKLVKRGSIFAFSDGKVIMGQQMGDGSIYVSVWMACGETWMETSGFDVWDGMAAKEYLCAKFSGWSPDAVQLIKAADAGTITPRSLFMLPVGVRWKNRPGITLIGDAAHLMTPFVGQGVNAALRDAMDLAISIVRACRGDTKGAVRLHSAVESFEEGMFRRVIKVQAMTEDMMRLMLFTEGAPKKVIAKWVVRSMSDDLNWFQGVVFKATVHFYYFLFNTVQKAKAKKTRIVR